MELVLFVMLISELTLIVMVILVLLIMELLLLVYVPLRDGRVVLVLVLIVVYR